MSDLFDYLNRDVELFFGFVGPIGTNLDFVIDELVKCLKEYNYNTKIIGVIKILSNLNEYNDLPLQKGYNGRLKKMDAGNNYRKKVTRNDALAMLALGQIREERTSFHKEVNRKEEENFEDSNKPIPRQAYIIKSLKTPEEIELLREIYEENFYVVSVYSRTAQRKQYLKKKLSEEEGTFHPEDYDSKVSELIKKDEEEEENPFGQNIAETFPLADIFIDVDNEVSTQNSIKRFTELIFGYSVLTPLISEFAMYLAKAASLRSSALSRQVGATLVDEDGEIISVGFNEAPKPGGGLYSADDSYDHRDFRLGEDISDRLRKQTIIDIINRLNRIPELSLKNTYNNEEINDIVEKYLFKQQDSPIKKAQAMNIIEFGRTVHAEMATILDAARRGLNVKGAELYVTTFPCHECTRHIISAGIKKVIYIEPYPKSLVIKLHSDAVEVEQLNHYVDHPDKLEYVPFIGISPRKFDSLFQMTKRKNEMGSIIKQEKTKLHPKKAEIHHSYINKETLAFGVFKKINENKNIY